MNLDAAEVLATSLIYKHLEDDNGDVWWVFEWDQAIRRFGATHFRDKRITLSERLTFLNSEDQVRDTILHEIAHALAGPNEGHGKVWKVLAKSIGCSGERCYSSADVVKPRPKFVGTCKCSTRFRLVNRRTKGLYCMVCMTDVKWERSEPKSSRPIDTLAAANVE